ncbi:MAG: RNA-binding protein [Oscillospiraceae bacterium]
MIENTELLTRMEDFVRKAQKTGIAHSKFLTPAETEEVKQAFKSRKDITLIVDGGFDEAERNIAVFVQPDWGTYEPEEVLTGLEINHRVQDTLRHQDILGAVLALGISRDVLGDILIQPSKAVTVCLASMAEFIVANLEKAGRVGVKINTIATTALPVAVAAPQEKTVTVASLRLDAVISSAFNCSRSSAVEYIRAGRVQLSHQECLNTSREVKENNIISVRGQGRVKLLTINQLTRKGRICITLGIYA